MIPRALKFAGSVGCFAIALLLVCAVSRTVFPIQPETGRLHRKLEYLAAHRDEFNALFLGSSRVFRQISPAIFDAVAAEHGAKLRSFNFGMDGMFAPEDSYVCEQIFKLRPKFEWVFLEVSTFYGAHVAEPNQSQRVVNWHDWPRTLSFVRSYFQPRKKARNWSKRLATWRERREELAEAWPELIGHLRCFVLRTVNLGRGATLLNQSLQRIPPEKSKEDGLVTGDRGYTPISTPIRPADLALFKAEFEQWQAKPPRYRPLTAEAQRNMEHMLGLIRAAGAKPVLFTTPVTAPIVFLPKGPKDVPLFDFCDFRKYPDLYKLENRQENAHLNKAGAEVFSRLFAEEWVKVR